MTILDSTTIDNITYHIVCSIQKGDLLVIGDVYIDSDLQNSNTEHAFCYNIECSDCIFRNDCSFDSTECQSTIRKYFPNFHPNHPELSI